MLLNRDFIANAFQPKDLDSLKDLANRSITELKELKQLARYGYLDAVLRMKKSSISGAAEVIPALTSEDLLLLDDQKDKRGLLIDRILPDSIRGAENQDNNKQILAWRKIIQREVDNRSRFYTSQRESQGEVMNNSVIIRQVIPIVGIFRGCIGGDCSSRLSFPYPNDPHEKVFVVYEKSQNGDEKLRGYLSATEVALSRGKKGLYIITINGSTVTGGVVQMIVRGLDQVKEKLGVQHILLPETNRLDALMNFPAIRYEFKKFSNSGKPLEISYQNHEIRSKIEGFSSEYNSALNPYDSMKFNTNAVLFSPYFEGLRPQIPTAKVTELKAESFLEVPNLENGDILAFLLDLEKSRRFHSLDRIFSIPEMRELLFKERFNRLTNEFSSCQEKTYSEWRNGLIDLIKGLSGQGTGTIDPEKFLETHPHLLYPGL